MKPTILTSAIVLTCAAGSALADTNCGGTPVADAATLLSNSLVCGRPGVSYPPAQGGPTSADRWQEEHLTGLPNPLWDYKLGPGDAVDPRKLMGQWSARGSLVNHTYDTFSPTYSVNWTMYPITVSGYTNTYSFCIGTAEHVRAILVKPIPATGGCAGVGFLPYP